ncbi:limonene-1,2-epoxide hydrolase family protein [Comamonas testosteroni]|uniref:limonene-1,2-epoxide hydrolase family protein n=1 Tax=Comamonas testosteroni TaxID=285 RepID=UPI0009B802DC|nr:limonene-1,2-epoxide hydrolase family protein [Comamonas testosteroni]
MAMTSLDDELKIQTFMTMKDCWERKDWRQCADLMTEDGILHSVMLDPCKGRENIYERIRKTEKPNKSVTLHIRSIGVASGVLFVERNDEITLDGVSHSIPTVGILEFAGEKISHWREYYDRATLLAAIQEPAHG